MFTAAQNTTAKIRSQPKCSTVMNGENIVSIHNTVVVSHKKNGIFYMQKNGHHHVE